jgi:hypothetical protein
MYYFTEDNNGLTNGTDYGYFNENEIIEPYGSCRGYFYKKTNKMLFKNDPYYDYN